MEDRLSNLPEDVLLQILIKLPTKSLLQLLQVSKLYNSLIKNHRDYFLLKGPSSMTVVDRQLLYCEDSSYGHRFYSYDTNDGSFKSLPPPVPRYYHPKNSSLTVVGSTMGVVCLVETDDKGFIPMCTLFLWNPSIGKVKHLPSLPFTTYVRSATNNFMAFGFGFDHVSLDFKIVMILYDFITTTPGNEEFDATTLVYEVKTGCLRTVTAATEKVPCSLYGDSRTSVYVDGVMYWLGSVKHSAVPCVMGFDVVAEVFNVVQLPQLPRLIGPVDFRLSASADGKSLLLFVSYGYPPWSVHVFRMKKEDHSWKEIYCITDKKEFVPIKFINDGKLLASRVLISSAYGTNKLVLLDAEKPEEFDVLTARGLPTFQSATGYTPTLAFLDPPCIPRRRRRKRCESELKEEDQSVSLKRCCNSTKGSSSSS